MKIAYKINYGIDLIRVSVSDGIPGFILFLEAYDGSFGNYLTKTKFETKFTFNINSLNLEGKYNHGAKRLILKIGALTQYSDTSRAYGRWSLLQMLYRHYTSALSVNELHFAVDLPYYYSEIDIKPEDCVYRPSFRSTRYFDTRRGQGKKLKSIDSFVIYDKCRKCRIGIPLTRIELRLKLNKSDILDIFSSTTTQQKIANKINKKFNEIRIQKGRSYIRLNSCSWYETISIAMNFIVDITQHISVLMHRTEEVWHTGEVFKDFMKFCAQNHIYSAKPQKTAKTKPYLAQLLPQERQMLNRTIASYNAYDSKWYRDRRFRMKNEEIATKLTDKLKEEILFLVQNGQTQSSIAEELNVSESTISRWLDGYVRIRDSRMLGLVSL